MRPQTTNRLTIFWYGLCRAGSEIDQCLVVDGRLQRWCHEECWRGSEPGAARRQGATTFTRLLHGFYTAFVRLFHDFFTTFTRR